MELFGNYHDRMNWREEILLKTLREEPEKIEEAIGIAFQVLRDDANKLEQSVLFAFGGHDPATAWRWE